MGYTEEITFYDDRYSVTEAIKVNTGMEVDLNNPARIYNYLLTKVYKQDDYCRNAAMILFDHLRGITSRNIVCGPAGSGKTYVWECLRAIYPRIIVVNAATLSCEGWRGENKVTSFLDRVDIEKTDCIVVFDEFDKCASPKTNSGGENVSASLQSEFLKLVEGEVVKTKRENKDISIDTSNMSFVFCGSFAQKATEIAEKASSSGFGFGSEKKESALFERELTIEDVVEFGVIPELASRCTRIVNVRPLTQDDFVYLITKHSGSPVKLIEDIKDNRETDVITID